MTGKGGSNQLELLHQTSLFMYETAELPSDRETRLGVQTLPVAPALCRSSPALYSHEPVKAEIALRMVEPADLVRILLRGGHTSIAGRLIGAYRFLGDTDAARFIESSMINAGHQVRPENPFAANQPVFGKTAVRITSPYAARIRAQWQAMREPVINRFPGPSRLTTGSIASICRVYRGRNGGGMEELTRIDACFRNTDGTLHTNKQSFQAVYPAWVQFTKLIIKEFLSIFDCS